MSFGKKILNIGVINHPDPYLVRTARFVNLFSIITITGLIIGSTNVFFLGKNYPYLSQITFLLLASLTLIFNYYHCYNLAVYSFLISLNTSIFYVNEYYDISAAPYLFYFPLILCVALLHNPTTGVKRTTSYFGLSMLFIGTSVFFEFENLRNTTISAHENYILFLFDLAFCVVISVLLVILVIKLMDGQNHELMASLKKEKQDQEKLSQSLKEKEILLQEIHHRVKNNLSVISSLLNLQISVAKEPESKQLLSDTRLRVLSMSLVHQKLYKGSNFNEIQFDKYVDELIHELINASPYKGILKLHGQIDPCTLDISTAIPLGLIINEIITNCIKHAFSPRVKHPEINLSLKKTNNTIVLIIKDNGVGFDYKARNANVTSLGLTLIETLADQIDGKILFTNQNGSEYKISLTTPITALKQ